jgi:hypothetical protein
MKGYLVRDLALLRKMKVPLQSQPIFGRASNFFGHLAIAQSAELPDRANSAMPD